MEQYVKLRTIAKTLEGLLGRRLKDIKSEIDNFQVGITEDDIKNYLNSKFEENDNDLKKSVENSYATDDEKIKALKYKYNPETLIYFKEYISRLKLKTKALLYLIEKISKGEIDDIQADLADLDVIIVNGISDSDIKRLIMPVIYNIHVLREKSNKANHLSTYLNNKIYYNGYTIGNDVKDCYPDNSLQIKSFYNDLDEGNVKLSSHQIERLENSAKVLEKR